MIFHGFDQLRQYNLALMWRRYQLALKAGHPMPCEVCWADPDAYIANGHVCNADNRRNHSMNGFHASGTLVAYDARRSMPMTDKEYEAFVRKASRRPSWKGRR